MNLFNPSLYSTVAATFLPWYFWQMPRKIVRTYIWYARTLADMFSFIFLIKYVLAPWKSLTDDYPVNQFQLAESLAVWSLNTISRVIGAIIRTATFAIGLAAEAICLGVFALFLVAWLAFPFALPMGIEFILRQF